MNLVKEYEINLIKEKESFIEYLDVNELTIKAYKDGIQRFIEYIKINNIKQPTRLDFKAFRDEIKQNMTINTVNSYLTANRGFFRYLEANNIYPNITKDIKNLKTSNIPIHQVLSQDVCKEICSSLTDKREKALFALFIVTGLRATEVSLAKIENIKEHNGEIVLFVKCKKRDDESEYVKLPQLVLDAINDYIEHRNNGYIFVSTSNNNKGQGITSTSVRNAIKKILKRFGYDEDGLSCHTLRRSMATISYNNGADMVSIQQVLHQKSISTTRRYIQQCTRDNNKLEYNVSNLILN